MDALRPVASLAVKKRDEITVKRFVIDRIRPRCGASLKAHRALAGVNPHTVVTMNYDDLYERCSAPGHLSRRCWREPPWHAKLDQTADAGSRVATETGNAAQDPHSAQWDLEDGGLKVAIRRNRADVQKKLAAQASALSAGAWTSDR
ncbi:MAG: hypothetical protein ACR2N0_16970 [Rubrobacteraceae bacterium]